MATVCPECGVENPSDARRCGCGHEFGEPQVPPLTDEQRRRRLVNYLVLFCCLGMAVQGLFATLSRKPDGRMLNTAPWLGVDVFLFVGVFGILYSIVRLRRGR